jgi:putative ABC transport system permease protein
MFRNYFKTAFRNIRRNSAYAIINVLGLAVGIAACILIFIVISFETSFDDFHKKKDNIYRVNTRYATQDGVSYSAGVAFPMGPALRTDLPQIKEVASVYRSGGDQVTIDNGAGQKKFSDESFYFVDTQFFGMFDIDWLEGNAKTSLAEPNNIALTQATAERFFGDWRSAIGKTIKRNNKDLLKVTGILKNTRANTDFPFEIVVSYSTMQNTGVKRNLTDWVSTFGQASVFVVLPPNYSQKQFDADLLRIAKKYKPAEYQKDAFVSQPLKTVHYDERFGNYRQQTFSKELITALTLIGIFLLIIACVNFINLATAQAVNRSREVGVRKVLGGSKLQLALQFLSETAIITLVALIIATVISYITLPFLNQLLGVQMEMHLGNLSLILFLVMIAFVVTILSGLYPAAILSRFNPITALKSKVSAKMVGGINLRRGLVIFQFAIAHTLIIGTLIVVSQMNFFRNASLGFDKASIITVPIPGDSISHTKIEFLRNELKKNTNIQFLSFSYASPSADGNWNSDFKYDHAAKNSNFSANLKWADVDYFKTYNIEFVAGRPYYASDTVREFVVNETLLKKLGVTDAKAAIGKQMDFWDGQTVGTIAGVIKDFNSYSLREPMAPVVLSTLKDVYHTINIKIKAGKEKDVLPFVESKWNNSYPDYAYQYQFLDETIAAFYQQEDRLSQLYKIFAGIAIFISCLGLYGLVSFMAVQRTKEMGIRKVLGATVRNIIFLLSKEFTFLIIIAFVIAGPVAYYIMHKWLQDYTYRVNIGVSIFVIAIASSIVIAWLTVGHRAIKAALANPVKNLRSE